MGQFTAQQQILEEFIDENDSWLLVGIQIRDSFFVTQYLERHSASSDRSTHEEIDVTS